jgi:hypothetical protein
MFVLRRSIGAVLTLAFVVTIGARCLIGLDPTAAQMACCVGTDHDCQSVGAEDCCVGGDAQSQPPAVGVQSITPALAALSPAFATIPIDTLVAARRLVHDSERGGPSATSSPLYIRLGALLI